MAEEAKAAAEARAAEEVKAAEEKALQRTVALRVLHQECQAHPTQVLGFIREAHAFDVPVAENFRSICVGADGEAEGVELGLENRGAAPVDLAPQPNGPVRATGPLVVLNDAGEVTDRTMQAFLCRCGKSAKQPYCDGTHRRVGFVAP